MLLQIPTCRINSSHISHNLHKVKMEKSPLSKKGPWSTQIFIRSTPSIGIAGQKQICLIRDLMEKIKFPTITPKSLKQMN